MSDFYGDIRLGDTIDVKFTTRQISGAPATLASSPVISAYLGNNTTELTAGITLTVDFDSRTGLNNVRVVASNGNGYATATNYELVITTGTVNSVSVVGECIGAFSIENRSALMPTTAARTLDVSATGEGGVDWANVGTPSSTVDLSATTVKTLTDVPPNFTSLAIEAGNGRVDVGSFLGNPGHATAGRPEVNMTHILGTGVGTNIAQIGVNVISSGIGGIALGATGGLMTVMEAGTALAASTSVIRLQNSFSGDAAGSIIWISSNAGVESRIISSYEPGNKDATVNPPFANSPTGTVTYELRPFGAVPVDDPATETTNAAVKAKTDQIIFTVPNQIDSNIQYVNDVQVSGAGTAGNPWGP